MQFENLSWSNSISRHSDSIGFPRPTGQVVVMVSSMIFELLPARTSSSRFSVNPRSGPRKLHICRLFDLLHLSLLRRDIARAQAIWSILIRCREVDFSMLWDLGLRIIHLSHPNSLEDDDMTEKYLAYLKTCQNLNIQESAKVLLEYTLTLIAVGRTKDALDELQLYSSALPYSQHAALHEYAGMVTLAMAPLPQLCDDLDELDNGQQNIQEYLKAISHSPLFGRARAYFQRAKSLDSSCLISEGYLELMSCCASRDDDEADVQLS
ncbi:hypothetical protein O181_014855 [Austropuccinia psidii MF-1]|uniref:Uncharacterized protein n=1 Tax=Austropuccinia psidii MF-1 TaxID=1389203 RepID=A0A9Q3C2P2_9BASI|nr:hypothetical protein [Austropuccinia psidii MF-1]